ncbi:hypothetical protein ACFQZT_04060 [Paenibacillus sp. GCM10027628]|uniref:hypothetical protein n=1 Tax=Paenibacillus sp. GCM10027628 TaxID=3273413 RepID=UPI0036349282
MASARFKSVTMENIILGSIPFSNSTVMMKNIAIASIWGSQTALCYSVTMENIAIHSLSIYFYVLNAE